MTAAAIPARVLCLAALGLAGLGGCDAGTPAPPLPPPAPPPPPVPEVTVSFSAERLEVAEGDSGVVEVQFEGRHLTAPWEFRIAAPEGDSWMEDFELPDEAIAVPVSEAEEAVSGTASLTIRTLEDLQFAEGEETFVLQPVPVVEGGEVVLEVEAPLTLAIADAAVSPCAGVSLSALRWEMVAPSEERPGLPMPATTLTIELGGDGFGTTLDLIGPYASWIPDSRELQPYATFGINRWNLVAVTGGIRHELEINWPGEDAFVEPRNLELALDGGFCAEERIVSCSSTACELLP